MVMIPQQKMQFFLELMQQFGLNTYKRSTTKIPASHIAEIRRRDTAPEGQEFLDWEKVKDDFEVQKWHPE